MSKKVLIVDDAPETLALIEAVLQGQGYAVTTAQSAEEAMIKVKQSRPDLIILDVIMPEIDGFAFFKVLKKERSVSSIPVLVLTVRVRMEDTFRALGAEEFLAKPFDSQKLLDKIAGIIGSSEGQVSYVETPAQAAAANTSTATATIAPAKPAAKPAAKAVGIKKVFVVASSDSVTASIQNLLSSLNCSLDFATKDTQAISKASTFKPDIIVLEVLLNDRPSGELITKLRQISGLGKVPIIVFSFLDKENLTASVHQRSLAVDKARTACQNAGASDIIGGFEEGRFMQTIKKYL